MAGWLEISSNEGTSSIYQLPVNMAKKITKLCTYMHDLLLEHGFPLKNNNALFFSMHIVFSSVNKFTIGQIMSRKEEERKPHAKCLCPCPLFVPSLKSVVTKADATSDLNLGSNYLVGLFFERL